MLQPAVLLSAQLWIEEATSSIWILTATNYPTIPPYMIRRDINSYNELDRMALTSDHGIFAPLQISYGNGAPWGHLDTDARTITFHTRVNQDSYGAGLARLDLNIYPSVQPTVVLVGTGTNENANGVLLNPAIQRYAMAYSS
jgi:hypothetical protein